MGASDPRETQDFQRPEIERLFALALEAKLPRTRPLKSWEPARLNERHLAMVMMRAGGMQQKPIAQAFGATENNVSIILNHPDAELLLTKLQAMKATQTTDIEDRIRALAEPALGTLEDLFSPSDETSALKKAPMAFKMLELNGYGAKKKVEVNHEHQLNANPEQLGRLTEALRESRSIEDAIVVSSGPLPPESTGAAGVPAVPSSGSSQGASPEEN
jgi:hypothetical protein